jgi:hypothetical protein
MKECKRCGCGFEPSTGLINYCSVRCKNSREWSDGDKLKKSQSAKNSYKVLKANRNRGSNKLKLVCVYCNSEFYSYKNQTYCSKECYLSDPNSHKGKGFGGYREGSGRAKTGYYNGIYCGSTYELVWVIYQLDHSVQFERFEGVIEGDGIRYIPDFLIGNTIFEMKGYESDETVDQKTNLARIRGYDVVVLRKNDLKKEFEWVESSYTYRSICELYDDYKPKYTYKCSNCGDEFYRERKVKTNVKFCSRRCAGIAHPGRNFEGYNQYKKKKA